MNHAAEVLAVVLVLGVPAGLIVAAVVQRLRQKALEQEVARLTAEVQRLARAVEAAPTASPLAQPSAARPVRAPDQPVAAYAPQAPPPAPPPSAPPLPPPLPPLPTTPVPARPPAPRKAIDWESLVGVRLFSWIAGLAMLVAAISFLRWSIDNGWLVPAVRAAIGALTGVGLLVGAETGRARRYAVTAQSLAAAGVAILFATVFAAHALWDLLPALAAFPLLVLVAAVAMAYSVRRSSLTMALLGLAGGFATPILLSTGQDRPVGLFSYLLLLNAGLAWVAYKRRWPLLGAIALGVTALYQVGWVLRFLGESNLLVAVVIFLVFPAFGFLALLLSRRGAPAGQAIGQVARWTATLGAVPSVLFLSHAASSSGLAARWPLLLGFAVVLCAGLLVVAALQGPAWLHLLGTGAAVAAFWLLADGGGLPHDAWPLILLPLLALASVVLVGPRLASRRGWRLGDEARWAVLAVPVLVALVLWRIAPQVSGSTGDLLLAHGALLLLTAGTAAAAVRDRLGQLLLAAGLAALVAGFGLAVHHHAAPWTGLASALLLGAIGLASLLADERRSPGQPTGAWFAAGSAGLLVAGQLIPAFAEVVDRPLAGLVPVELLLLTGLLAVAARTARPAISLAAVATSALVVVPSTLDGSSRATDALALAATLWSAQVIAPWLQLRRGAASRLLPWAPVAASAVGLLLVRQALHALHLSVWVGPAALLMAVALVPHLRLLVAAPGGLEAERSRIVVLAGGMLGLVTAAIPLQLEKEWITLGWALLIPALAFLHRRVPHRGLLTWMAGLAGAVAVRLALNEAVLHYHVRSGMPVWNFWLYAYGVPALALFLAARLLAGHEDRPVPAGPRLSPILSGLGTLLLFLLLNLEIADAFSTGRYVRLELGGSLTHGLALTIGWACFAIGLLAAGIVTGSKPGRIAAIGLLAVTVVKGFLFDLGHLQGLYRVGSFVGLAVSLALVAVVLQRFVLSDRRPDPGP